MPSANPWVLAELRYGKRCGSWSWKIWCIIIPNKGAYVKGISQEDIQDIYMIRSRLEGLSARLAAEKITEEQLADLQEVLMLAEFHAAHGNFEKVFEMDSKFHELMYEASGSKQLHHLLSDYHHYVQRARKTFRVHQCAGRRFHP